MSSSRRIALAAGVFMIITFVASIAGLILYDPVLNDAEYVLGGGADTRIALGALCEIILCIANVGTAVVLFPVVRRQSEGFALGYVASRTIESTIIAIGIVSVLSVVTLRKDLAGTAGLDADSLVIAGRSLVAVHDWTFLLGPAFLAAIGNGILLGYLMFKSGLMPRRLAMFGLVGGPLLLVAGISVLFGAFEQSSVPSFLLTIPEIIWEASVGIYLTFKGFRSCAILDEYDAEHPLAGASG